MGNTSGKLTLKTFVVSNASAKSELEEILNQLDGDYDDFSEEIVDDIIERFSDKGLKKMIEALLDGDFKTLMSIDPSDNKMYEADLDNFFLINNSYCERYEFILTEIPSGILVSLAYVS